MIARARFFCDWPGLLRPLRHNWVDFHLIGLRFEWTRYMGRHFEVEAWLLGFGVEVTLGERTKKGGRDG